MSIHPISLPVTGVLVEHIAPGDWIAEVVVDFSLLANMPQQIITIRSGGDVELPPSEGDTVILRFPEGVSIRAAADSAPPTPCDFPPDLRLINDIRQSVEQCLDDDYLDPHRFQEAIPSIISYLQSQITSA